MTRAGMTIRTLLALVIVALGVVITARGIADSAPFTYVVMGVLFVVLGVVRLRLLRSPSTPTPLPWWERGGRASPPSPQVGEGAGGRGGSDDGGDLVT